MSTDQKVKDFEDRWKKMDALQEKEFRDDPGFTVAEYAERYKLGYNTAAKRLENLAKRGTLIAGWRQAVGPQGRKMRVYDFPK